MTGLSTEPNAELRATLRLANAAQILIMVIGLAACADDGNLLAVNNEMAGVIVVQADDPPIAWRLAPGEVGPMAYVSNTATISVFASDCTLLGREDLSEYALEPVFTVHADGSITYQVSLGAAANGPTSRTEAPPCSS
jgi:hypothetical protein